MGFKILLLKSVFLVYFPFIPKISSRFSVVISNSLVFEQDIKCGSNKAEYLPFSLIASSTKNLRYLFFLPSRLLKKFIAVSVIFAIIVTIPVSKSRVSVKTYSKRLRVPEIPLLFVLMFTFASLLCSVSA